MEFIVDPDKAALGITRRPLSRLTGMQKQKKIGMGDDRKTSQS